MQELPQTARVGTGSLRRQAQLRYVRPDLRIENIRGNVDTRVRKLDDGKFDAIVLAEAGLTAVGTRRPNFASAAVRRDAAGSRAGGARDRMPLDDATTFAAAALVQLDDADSHAAVLAERSLLAHLRGGCLAPIGALGRVEQDRLAAGGRRAQS